MTPGPPKGIEDTGLPMAFLVELACKALYFGGVLSLAAICDQLALPVGVGSEVVEFLKRERLAEVKKGADLRASYTYALTDLGRERAREYLQLSAYVGAAPITLKQYLDMAHSQTVRKMSVGRETMARAFEGIVLAPGLLERLGPAVNSGRSIFLYGPSGNGKTFLAERLAKILTGTIFIPHAVCIDGQVIRVFDPVNHAKVGLGGAADAAAAILEGGPEYDRRFVPCERPVVVAGGELTLSMLDLSFDPVAKFYEAPLQMKANGGVFLIDDLGRQLVRPFDLLNRWIVPLERSRDYLSLQNGKKFEIPFDQIILFSTNIEPRQLTDEAFLRRIGYKIKIDYLREEEYVRIFRQVCEQIGLPFRQEVVRYLLDEEHGRRGIRLSACHPADVLRRVAEICQYEGAPLQLDNALVARACRDYFTEL
jgi:hypothetical protein